MFVQVTVINKKQRIEYDKFKSYSIFFEKIEKNLKKR